MQWLRIGYVYLKKTYRNHSGPKSYNKRISNTLPLPISTMRGNVGSPNTSFQSGTSTGIYPETESINHIELEKDKNKLMEMINNLILYL